MIELKAVPFVNSKGYFIEDKLVNASFTENVVLEDESGTLIAEPVAPGLYKPRWDFKNKKWTEGLTTEEIEAIQNPEPDPEAAETMEQKLYRLEQADLNNKELIATLYEMLLAK